MKPCLLLLLYFLSLKAIPDRKEPHVSINISSEPVQEIDSKFIAQSTIIALMGSNNKALERVIEKSLTQQKQPKHYPELKEMREAIIFILGINTPVKSESSDEIQS